MEFPYEAKRRVLALLDVLEPMAAKTPAAPLRGIALRTLDATISEVLKALPTDPVAKAAAEAFVEEVHSDADVTVADALLVAAQLDAAIGPYPIVIA